MSKNNKVRIIYGSIIVAVFLCWILFGETAISQSWHMGLAKNHLPMLEKIAQTHPEFSNVKFQVSYGHDGCLAVIGWDETEKERAELKTLVEATKAPVYVRYLIKVQSSEK